MLDLSVVIVNHHHRGIIEKCIESLTALPDKVSIEVLVIDNTPDDGLTEWLDGRFRGVTARPNRVPMGYAANANLGLRTAARGRYAMMLNPDVICFPGLLENLVAYMDSHPMAGLAGPRLLNAGGTLQHSCRRFPTPVMLGARFFRLESVFPGRMEHYLMKDWDHATEADVDWVTGAIMILRREAIAAIGAMDESYFMYWEDLDLCLRLWHGGWRVGYVPGAHAEHAHLRQGVKEPFSRFARWQVASAFKLFWKFGWCLSREGRPAESLRDSERR
ncbi:MAG: putative Glycosyl transferase family 2 [Bryobacterales bacterium]|nr:putative Glycosyl transferase family 2 [Bryobacterales bacterium]